MATSQTLLTVIAVRLAALVVAGLIAKAALPYHPQQEMACSSTQVAIEAPAPPAAKSDIDETVRDMLLHD